MAENFNGGWGGSTGRHLPLELFDEMPWRVRELYCFAAYDYTPHEAFEAVVAGKPVDLIVRVLRGAMKAALRREVLRLYGPEHPQAQA